MVQGFLFNGIKSISGDNSVSEQLNCFAVTFAGAANAGFARCKSAEMGTKKTFNFITVASEYLRHERSLFPVNLVYYRH